MPTITPSIDPQQASPAMPSGRHQVRMVAGVLLFAHLATITLAALTL